MTVTPGPGLPALLLGAMLIAGESRRAALALDRLELAVRRQSPLLACGIAAPVVYIAADIVAARLYPGYSYRDQAVSELFAIGAPTSPLVVLFFSLSSLLYAAFAVSVWRLQRAMACMILANARRCVAALGISFRCTCAAPRPPSPTPCMPCWPSIPSSY